MQEGSTLRAVDLSIKNGKVKPRPFHVTKVGMPRSFVNVLSLRQAITPNRLLGRVAASNQVITGGMAPIGSFVGGVIGSAFGLETSLVVGIVGMFLAAGWIVWSPVAGLRTLPTVEVGLTGE